MTDFVLAAIIIAVAASAGGLIALFTAKEIKQYKKWIFFSEVFLAAILAGLLITINEPIYILMMPIGAVLIVMLNRVLPETHIYSFLKMLFIGIGFGILFKWNMQYAFLFGTVAALHNVIKGSRIGEALMRKRKNVFKGIGLFQAVFILGAFASYYFCTRDFGQLLLLNLGAGMILGSFFIFRK